MYYVCVNMCIYLRLPCKFRILTKDIERGNIRLKVVNNLTYDLFKESRRVLLLTVELDQFWYDTNEDTVLVYL